MPAMKSRPNPGKGGSGTRKLNHVQRTQNWIAFEQTYSVYNAIPYGCALNWGTWPKFDPLSVIDTGI